MSGGTNNEQLLCFSPDVGVWFMQLRWSGPLKLGNRPIEPAARGGSWSFRLKPAGSGGNPALR